MFWLANLFFLHFLLDYQAFLNKALVFNSHCDIMILMSLVAVDRGRLLFRCCVKLSVV